MDLKKRLYLLQDIEYKRFQERLLPNVSSERIIGVRTPALRKLARELMITGEAEHFLSVLPHHFFEENQIHSFILAEERDYDHLVVMLERFLPYIDNWATCDQLLPKVFRGNHEHLDGEIRKWLTSSDPYTVRFAIGMRMKHFLDVDFKNEYLEEIAQIDREEYYIKMMVAWFLATALDKRYLETLTLLKSGRLERFTHNKTISKAIESYRIPIERKEELRRLRK